LSTEASWKPRASLAHLKKRAACLKQIRLFFEARDVLEVSTPALQRHTASDPYLESFQATSPHHPERYFLQTSPEYAMKRLLCAYPHQSVYQITQAFRVDERGRQHQPNFTLLEWYRMGMDHHALMDEIHNLLCLLLPTHPCDRISYRDAFLKHAQVDPFTASLATLQNCASEHAPGLNQKNLDADTALQLIMSHAVEPKLGKGCVFVYDFPTSQAALARINTQASPPTASRFELYIDGLECANGFHELADAEEQAARFKQDNQKRKHLGRDAVKPDVQLLRALAHGLPNCAGVALGIDRLMMAVLNSTRIDETMAFVL
jgi:elongation factor P--(R)-beta-lysine ligase